MDLQWKKDLYNVFKEALVRRFPILEMDITALNNVKAYSTVVTDIESVDTINTVGEYVVPLGYLDTNSNFIGDITFTGTELSDKGYSNTEDENVYEYLATHTDALPDDVYLLNKEDLSKIINMNGNIEDGMIYQYLHFTAIDSEHTIHTMVVSRVFSNDTWSEFKLQPNSNPTITEEDINSAVNAG